MMRLLLVSFMALLGSVHAAECSDGDYLRKTPLADNEYRLQSARLAAEQWPPIPLYAFNIFALTPGGDSRGNVIESQMAMPILREESASILLSCGTRSPPCNLEVVAESHEGLALAWKLGSVAPHFSIPIYPSYGSWLKLTNSEAHFEFGDSGGYDFKTNYSYGLFRSLVEPEGAPNKGLMSGTSVSAGDGTVIIHLGWPQAHSLTSTQSEAKDFEDTLVARLGELEQEFSAASAFSGATARLSFAGVFTALSSPSGSASVASEAVSWWATLMLTASTGAEAADAHVNSPALAALLAAGDYVVLRPVIVDPGTPPVPVAGVFISLPSALANPPPLCSAFTATPTAAPSASPTAAPTATTTNSTITTPDATTSTTSDDEGSGNESGSTDGRNVANGALRVRSIGAAAAITVLYNSF